MWLKVNWRKLVSMNDVLSTPVERIRLSGLRQLLEKPWVFGFAILKQWLSCRRLTLGEQAAEVTL